MIIQLDKLSKEERKEYYYKLLDDLVLYEGLIGDECFKYTQNEIFSIIENIKKEIKILEVEINEYS